MAFYRSDYIDIDLFNPNVTKQVTLNANASTNVITSQKPRYIIIQMARATSASPYGVSSIAIFDIRNTQRERELYFGGGGTYGDRTGEYSQELFNISSSGFTFKNARTYDCRYNILVYY